MSEANPTEEFLALYNRHQRQIYAHIRTMVGHRDDAEEVFQETCIALWRAFDQFEQGTSFAAWSRQIARYRVLAFLKRRRGDRLRFQPDAIEAISDDVERISDDLNERRAALVGCLDTLNPDDRQLIDRHYQQGCTAVALASELKRPLNTVYKALARIRRSLHACIERTLSQGGRR